MSETLEDSLCCGKFHCLPLLSTGNALICSPYVSGKQLSVYDDADID
jgi:hypothetical protein